MNILRFRSDPTALTIRQVLEVYLNERARTRSPRSIEKLKTTISLFVGFLHAYGYTALKAGPERDAYQEAWDTEHRYFEDFGGPELLDRLFIQYMGYFISWECPMSEGMTKEARAFVRDAAAWLRDQGYITDSSARRVRTHAMRCTKNIVRSIALTHEINDIVFDPAYSREDRDKSAEIESGFTIASAADGVIGVTLEGSSYTFRLPPLLVERLRGFLGCVITARLAPVEDGTEHRLLIVGKILPHPTEEEVPMLEEHRHG